MEPTITITEDFISPRNYSGIGTKIETLPAGDDLGMMEDLYYFQAKLHAAYGLPASYIRELLGLGDITLDDDAIVVYKETRLSEADVAYECAMKVVSG